MLNVFEEHFKNLRGKWAWFASVPVFAGEASRNGEEDLQGQTVCRSRLPPLAILASQKFAEFNLSMEKSLILTAKIHFENVRAGVTRGRSRQTERLSTFYQTFKAHASQRIAMMLGLLLCRALLEAARPLVHTLICFHPTDIPTMAPFFYLPVA